MGGLSNGRSLIPLPMTDLSQDRFMTGKTGDLVPDVSLSQLIIWFSFDLSFLSLSCLVNQVLINSQAWWYLRLNDVYGSCFVGCCGNAGLMSLVGRGAISESVAFSFALNTTHQSNPIKFSKFKNS
jgi:hypothetical protein